MTIKQEDIVQEVRHFFIRDISPFVRDNTLTKHQANEYFRVIFRVPELVSAIRTSLTDKDYRMRSIRYTKEFTYMDEFTKIKKLYSSNEFTIYLEEIFEPRDVAYYVSFIIRPSM